MGGGWVALASLEKVARQRHLCSEICILQCLSHKIIPKC